MKILKKVIFWITTIMVVMFLGCWTLSTASRMHIGEKFPNAVVNGFDEVADEIGKMVGFRNEPDIILNFKNGEVGFGNTHISW